VELSGLNDERMVQALADHRFAFNQRSLTVCFRHFHSSETWPEIAPVSQQNNHRRQFRFRPAVRSQVQGEVVVLSLTVFPQFANVVR
jgi:hypothetical protein